MAPSYNVKAIQKVGLQAIPVKPKNSRTESYTTETTNVILAGYLMRAFLFHSLLIRIQSF